MALAFNHDDLVQKLGLLLEKHEAYGLVKFWVPWGDAKTDLIGQFYPDVTCLRREGRKKIMIEVQTPYSFEDSDEVRRLSGLSEYCQANGWEFYIVCADEATRELTKSKTDGKGVRPAAIWLMDETPFSG